MKPISALIKEYASLGKGRENQHKKYIDLISEIDSTVMSQTTPTSEQRPKESTLSKYVECVSFSNYELSWSINQILC